MIDVVHMPELTPEREAQFRKILNEDIPPLTLSEDRPLTTLLTLHGNVYRSIEHISHGPDKGDTTDIVALTFNLDGALFKVYEHNARDVDLPPDGPVTIIMEWKTDD